MTKPNILVVGSLNMDIVVQAPRFPKPGETLTGKDSHFIPGGKGANQAVAAARLGAQTSMLGAVGDDLFGQALLESLQIDKVGFQTVKKVKEVPTGIAAITLTSTDNQIIVVPGANEWLTIADIAANEAIFAEADVVLLQLEVPLPTVMAAASMAKKHGKIVVLNPAPAQKLPDSLLRNVDYITPNLTELEQLTGIDSSKHGLEKAVDELLRMGPPQVVTTLGSEGTVYKQAGGSLVQVPAYRVPVVDTTGAGDSFNAALAVQLAKGADLHESILYAVKVSALAVTQFGAQSGMPTSEQVDTFEASLRDKEQTN
ncbi:ribokinase [Cohnella silvisoli]|uniref:Ribokinase n=1 Tax=Cohnella silvisoli TaxID=2873699 RepID=A0ABV1KVS2_9BACL|nr:ribokinase [Cohnella silvisoli]MCD9023591.1 ribokinase [Cohnella silvisoli]